MRKGIYRISQNFKTEKLNKMEKSLKSCANGEKHFQKRHSSICCDDLNGIKFRAKQELLKKALD